MGWVILLIVILVGAAWFGAAVGGDEDAFVDEEPEEIPEESTFMPSEELQGIMEKQGPDIALRADMVERARENGGSRDHAILGVPENCSEDALHNAYQAGVSLWNPLRFWKAPPGYRKVVNDQYRLLQNAYEAICAERGWTPEPFVG